MLINYVSIFSVDSGTNWLTPELLSLFMFHEIRILSEKEEMEIISELVN